MTDHLSPLDIAFLAMEGDSHPLHLGAVATFAPSTPVHPARIAAVLCERAQEIPRLRQRARTSLLGGARWVEDPGFAPEDHVFTHHVRGRVDAVSTGEFSVGGRVFISTDEAMSNVSLIPCSDGIDGMIDRETCSGMSGMDSREGSNS